MRRLAAVYPSLPPVLVHRPTMRVVDGMHRIRAAMLKDLDTVEVTFFEGAEDQVFLRSVTANISNGLPLSVADRKTAAARILATHPSLSDRAVATHVGLDAKTVAGVRVCSSAGSPLLNVRTGADGRAHPLDRTAERMHAAALLSEDPALPLRTVVERTGLSLGTAHDVRRRLLRGEDPVPTSRQGGTPPAGSAPGPAGSGGRAGAGSPGDGSPGAPAAPGARTDRAPADRAPAGGAPAAARGPGAGPGGSAPGGAAPLSPRSRAPLDTLRKLANDPSLRHSDTGREFMRWLHTRFIVDEAWRRRADAIPPHSVDSMAHLAQHCSDVWRRFAEELVRRRHTDTTDPREAQTTQSTWH
ncbi:transcriptional regulator [Streptomyces jumonjinensis]|uniref:transcriptional regulator n=1 Tax=Streptomyces jumonjinensis TaxID=1945 RepID=UPI0037B522A0